MEVLTYCNTDTPLNSKRESSSKMTASPFTNTSTNPRPFNWIWVNRIKYLQCILVNNFASDLQIKHHHACNKFQSFKKCLYWEFPFILWYAPECYQIGHFRVPLCLCLKASIIKALANEDTLLRTHCCPSCFLGCANWETFVADTTCFWTKSETFFVSRTQNLCLQQMLRARANGETFVSATMWPQQCVLVCQSLLILHENETACRTHFHMKGFALRLVLKQRHKRTRKWPI